MLTLIDFSQNLVQAMWKDDDLFLQIPHMTEEKVKQMKRKVKKQITIEDFCRLTPQERKDLELFETPQQLDDCEKAIKVFPLIELTVEPKVEGEEEIAVGDFLTYKISITLLNSGENE